MSSWPPFFVDSQGPAAGFLAPPNSLFCLRVRGGEIAEVAGSCWSARDARPRSYSDIKDIEVFTELSSCAQALSGCAAGSRGSPYLLDLCSAKGGLCLVKARRTFDGGVV